MQIFRAETSGVKVCIMKVWKMEDASMADKQLCRYLAFAADHHEDWKYEEALLVNVALRELGDVTMGKMC